MYSSSRELRLKADPEAVARRAQVGPAESSLERGIEAATAALLKLQRADGHWVFELEADATIAAEYVVLQHFLGEPNPALEAKIAIYLRRVQGPHRGWAVFPRGALHIPARAQACVLPQLARHAAEDPHMRPARPGHFAPSRART